MIRSFRYGLKMSSQPHRERTRGRRCRRPLGLEGLEDRVLLSLPPTTYMVTDTSDLVTDTGSLVYAIKEANANPNPAGSLIEFSTPLFSTPQTITLTSTLELSDSAGPITIGGPGANLLTVSGNNAVRVFQVDYDVTADIVGLTISGGKSSGDGGGVDSIGTLTLSSSTITDNSAGNEGGGVYNENASMTISNCMITNNTATDDGGGVYNDELMTISGSTITHNTVSSGGGDGGGIYNSSYMTISYSTIANNTVSGGGDGGGIYNDYLLVVAYSTIADNSASGSGGEGGGVFNDDTLTIPDSTIADNSATSHGGGIVNDYILTAVNTTVAYNFVSIGGTGGGLFIAAGETTTLDNTIVAQNTHLLLLSFVADDVAGTITTTPPSTFSLIGTGGSGGLTNGVNGNQVDVANPGLGSLANNGGPTSTIALLAGSPAVDAGSNVLDGLPTDQRELARIINGAIDIGAYELQPALITTVSVGWGAAGTAALQTASDGLRLLPAGRNTDIPWLGIDKLQIAFNEPETLTSAEVTLTGVKGTNYGPVTITGSGETYTIILARPITKPDRVMIVIAGAGIATYVRRLDVLPCDFNDDGVVNAADAKGVKNELLGVTPATIFGDVLGDGSVDAADYKAVKKLEGKKFSHLPKALAVLARSLARQRFAMEHHRH
jgi:Dockerin type I domain/Right handed beta helix region